MGVFTPHARFERDGLIKHNAVYIACEPGVAYRFMPGCAKFLGGMNTILCIFRLILMVTDTGIERQFAQLRRQVHFREFIVFWGAFIYNIAGSDTESGEALI